MENKCYWFAFYEGQVWIEKRAGGWHIPLKETPPVAIPEGATVHTVGVMDGCEAKAYALAEPVGETGGICRLEDLRASFDVLPWDEYRMAGKASQILTWDRDSKFCPRCGVPTRQVAPIAKRCPVCGREIYPRISPAVIVLIKRGEDEVLLVHARNFRGTFKGLVAGFLEPGETLEECVRREVMEETGLAIKNLKYFGSQPWPYPSGIMVGYSAEYESGTIKLQDEELSTGAFYHRSCLPELPKKLSIARRLIDAWLEGKI